MTAPVFRLETPEEAFARTNLTPQEEQWVHPARKHRWHCMVCGRFVPFSTVRKVQPSGPDWVDEHEYVGKCGQDDVVEVTWGNQ